MTERFIVDTAGTLVDMVTRDTFDYVSDVVGLLNGYDKENERLKNMVRHSYVEHKRCVNNYVDKIKEVEKENEQLEQRNTNQYQQLNQLWQLIEAKDWETLTEMNNQMKEDEKRLQQEWKCYE